MRMSEDSSHSIARRRTKTVAEQICHGSSEAPLLAFPRAPAAGLRALVLCLFLLSLCGMPWFLLSLVVCVNGTMVYHTTHLESACVPQHSQLAAYRGISGTWKDHDIINIQLTRSRPSQSLEKTATPAPGKQYSYLYTRRLIRRFHPPGNLTQNYNTPKQSRVL
jgi:hypothetical protein